MALSSDLIAVSIDVIDQFGKEITIRKATGITHDTTTASHTRSYTNVTQKAVIEAYKAMELIGMVKAGDFKVVLANEGTEPDVSDLLQIDGLDYNIVSVEPTYLQEEIVIFTVQARK